MSSRKFLFLFFLCCSLPVVAAKLYLESGWLAKSETNNKGQWMQQEVKLLDIHSKESSHWHLVYVQAGDCTKTCEHTLYTLQQLYTGFGRKQMNVKPLVLSNSKLNQLAQFPSLGWQQNNQPVTELQNTIVIVNQQGFALLRYPITDDLNQMIKTAKDIRTDLIRLMSYDRGGV